MMEQFSPMFENNQRPVAFVPDDAIESKPRKCPSTPAPGGYEELGGASPQPSPKGREGRLYTLDRAQFLAPMGCIGVRLYTPHSLN